MKTTAHNAKTPSAKVAIFAPLRAFLRIDATSAPSVRLAATLALALSLLLAPLASADGRIGLPTEEFADGGGAFLPGSAAGQLAVPRGVAVSAREGGDLYVADSGNQRIDQFDPSKPPAEQFVRAWGGGVVPGAATGTGTLSKGSPVVEDLQITSGAFLEGEVVTGPGIPADTHIVTATAALGISRSAPTTQFKLSNPATSSSAPAALTAVAGAGNVPTNETQSVTLTPSGSVSGNFKLRLFPESNASETANIPYNATAVELENALAAVIGAGNAAVTLDPGGNAGGEAGVPGGPWTVEFKGRYADTSVEQMGQETGTPALTSARLSLATVREGASAAEICDGSAGCVQGTSGSGPGQFETEDEIAVDNDPASASYGDVYVVDQRNLRVEKFSPSGEFLLMFGGEVDHTTHANICTAEDIEVKHDTCGAGVPGTAPAHFYQAGALSWENQGNNSIAVGPDGTVYVGDYGRVQKFEPSGAFLGEVPLPFEQFASSLAVAASGHLYVDSRAIDEIQIIHPPESGTYTLTFKGQTTPPLPFNAFGIQAALEALSTIGPGNVRVGGSGAGERDVEFVGALANTNVPQITASAGSVKTNIEGATPKLLELGASGEVLQAFDTEAPTAEPTHIALGPTGTLYAADLNGSNQTHPSTAGFVFRAFEPDASLLAEFTSDQVEPSRGPGGEIEVERGAGGIALDPSGTLYATSFAPEGDHVAVIAPLAKGAPIVKGEHVTDLEPTTATLRATVNPEGFKTKYHFEYGTQAGVYTHFTATQELPLTIREDPVQAAISELKPETAYHYRLVAESSEGTVRGEDATLTTLPPVSVREFTTQTVGPELLTLKAELNPNGSETHYTIHYGTESGNYSEGAVEGVLPVGNEFVKREVTFTGLKPHTTYHYQLVAKNGYEGELKTADQSFTTELSAAEERAAEHCPNTNLREEDSALTLPDCRDYEQVSPPFKGAYPVNFFDWLSPSGERVAYESGGVFAGSTTGFLDLNSYVAHRTPSGWVSQAAVGRPAGPEQQPKRLFEYSGELDRWAFPVSPGFGQEQAESSTSNSYYVGDAAGTFTQASPTLEEGASAQAGFLFDPILAQSDDLSRLYLANNGDNSRLLNEVSPGEGGGPTLRVAAAVPPSLKGEGCNVDDRQYLAPGARLASADGSTLIYNAPLATQPGAECDHGGSGAKGPNKYAVFARTGEAPAVQLSAKSPSQCSAGHLCDTAAPADATFYGVSPDGTRAWFTTEAPLIDSDSDSTNDLYLAKLEHGELRELVQASAGETVPALHTAGEGAGVVGVLGLSQDGSTAAFIATGVLTADQNELHRSAQKGADNLYLYNATSRQTRFVAELCSGPEQSGSAADPACPAGLDKGRQNDDSGLWGSSPHEAHLTPDGRFLLFTSYGRLTLDKTSETKAVYRYDFQTGQLIRVSFGHDGNDANGNDNAYPAEIETGGTNQSALDGPEELAEDGGRSISADGSAVIFKTAAPLVSRDTNTGNNPTCKNGQAPSGCDIYEWREQGRGTCTEPGGCVSLISSGLDPAGSYGGVISPSGADITFITSRSLVPGDTDGQRDVYDAREYGGFHFTPPPIPCGGNETCHHQPPPPPPPPKIASENETGGNGPHQLECAKGKVRVKKHGQVRCVAKKHHHKKKRHKRANTNRRAGK